MDSKTGMHIAGNEGLTMHDRIRSMDWSKTPIGETAAWPESLKSTIRVLLGSRYPMILLWGDALIQIYNDAYTNLIGDKHPYALGRSIKETQAESWSTIGPMIHEVMSTGVSNWVPAQLLAVNRSGFNEETYFSLSYSAVEDDHNHISGMLCVCSEVTQQVLGERRLRIHRDLASRTGETGSVEKVCRGIADTLDEYPFDIPFMMLLLTQPDGTLKLEASTGTGTYMVNAAGNLWSLEEALKGNTTLIDDVSDKITVNRGVWNDLVGKALVLPVPSAVPDSPLGVFIAGISPNCVFDDNYRSFYELLTGQLSVALRNAFAFEEEKKRIHALAELDRAKTTFFSNVSHEFRTPLTLMLGPLEELLSRTNGTLLPADRAHVNTAYENALRLLKLVNALLDFSRIEANRAQATYTPVDLCAYTTELACLFESAAAKAGLTYTVDCRLLSEDIFVDREMWEKIIFNLISNALKFTFDGGIEILLSDTPGHAELVVRDTGTGIPQAELPNVFKRFHRIHNNRARSHEGTGIGLALTKELVELHGGTITVSSTEGKGTTFTVCIPKGNAHLDKSRISKDTGGYVISNALRQSYLHEMSLWNAESDGGAGTHATVMHPDREGLVLVADDNVQMLSYVSHILEPHWKVATVRDGVAAMTFLQHTRPDLILSDVMMPNMNGFELLANVRQDASLKDIPFILLSARAGNEATVEGLDKGANDYLVKPFHAQELVARVAAQFEIQRLRTGSADLEQKVLERTLDLSRTNDQLQQYAYVASHDLQEPLRKITFFSELLLQRNGYDAATRGYLEKIFSASGRMRILINDLLNFSKLADTDTAYERTDLNVIMQDVLADFELLITQKEATVMYDKLPVIEAVPLQMRQLFFNLIGNALKFTAEGRKPVITVSVAIAGEEELQELSHYRNTTRYYKISIADNGIGFASKYELTIFEMFRRLNDRSQFTGTGIGLALCKKIIINHNGGISASGRENAGAVFTMLLPEQHLFTKPSVQPAIHNA